MNHKRELAIIYPSRSKEKALSADFCTLLSFVSANKIQYRLIRCQPGNQSGDTAANGSQIDAVKNSTVYIHINDITWLPEIRELLATLKSRNNLILAGGHPAVTLEATEILNTFKSIDVIVRAPEDDKTLVELLKAILSNKRNRLDIAGITFRQSGKEPDGGQQIIINQSRPLSENIDHINNLAIYKQNLSEYEWYPLFISLGCEYNCRYCQVPEPYRAAYEPGLNFLKKKSAKKIGDEIEFLVSKGITQFQFFCNQFFDNDKTPAAIAREILERNLKIEFLFVSKINDIAKNLDSLPILKEAGLKNIHVGLDSGIARFNEMYQNGVTLDSSMKALKFMHEHNIDFDISYILYDPYLTPDELKETIVFLEKIEKYFAHLSLPYCAYLDSRILCSALVLKYGMPIIQKLKESQLIVEYPDYSSHPAAAFDNPETKRIYSLYSAVNNSLLPKIRHFFYNKALVEKYSFLNLFPLRLLEKILDSAQENKLSNLEEQVSALEAFIKSTFREHFETIDSRFEMYVSRELNLWLKESAATIKN